MTKLLILSMALKAVSLVAAPAGQFTFVDLTPHANQKLTDNFGRDGNDLAGVLSAGGTFAGVNFKLGKGVIQLGSKLLPKEMPAKVEGIKVNKTCVKLHILHATSFGSGQNNGKEGKEGDPQFVADGTLIAEYKIHYEDKSNVSIPVVYGEDVRDWWFQANSKNVSRGKVAWKGENVRAKMYGSQIRLYLTSWENPQPAKKIVSIDYVKVNDTAAAPFCVAITLEEKVAPR